MKKILLAFLFSLFFIGMASAWSNNTFSQYNYLCYQETANVSNNCGGLSTGNYRPYGISAWNNQQYLYDGDWGSAGNGYYPGNSWIEINYTIPNGVTNAIWQLKTGWDDGTATDRASGCPANGCGTSTHANSVPYTRNYTINSSVCALNNGVLTLRINSDAGGYFSTYSSASCVNSTGGEYVFYYAGYMDTYFAPYPHYEEIYEEAMIWNITSPNLTQENLVFTNLDNPFTRYLKIPSSVTALASVFLNLSGYNGSVNFAGYNGMCYQESVNISNQSGTDSACNHYYNGSVAPAPSAPYIYMNYTKPYNSSLGAVWVTKFGSDGSNPLQENITLSSSCYNAFADKVVLRFYTEFSYPVDQSCSGRFGRSYGQCYYSGTWNTITSDSYTTLCTGASGGSYGGGTAGFDGDWGTNVAYCTGVNCDGGVGWKQNPVQGSIGKYAVFYEEAMLWNVTQPLTYSYLQNVSLVIGSASNIQETGTSYTKIENGGATWGNYNEVYDGNWDGTTNGGYMNGDVGNVSIIVNYTKYSGTTTANWTYELGYWADGLAWTTQNYSISIPSSCLQNTISLRKTIVWNDTGYYNGGNTGYYDMISDCYNGTGWVFMQRDNSRELLTEEQLLFNAPSPWTYTGTFNQLNNRTNNLASIVNYYLTPSFLSGGFYYIPFIFSSASAGILKYSDMLFSSAGFLENSQTYSASSYETTIENYSLDFTYDSSAYTLSNVYLVYNGTSYLATTSGTGNNRISSKSLTVPVVATSGTQLSFYWNVSLISGGTTTWYTSSVKNQTVLKGTTITVGSSCGAGYTSAINFTSFYEANGTAVNFTTVNYYLTYGLSGNSSAYSINNTISNVPSFSICINNSQAYYDIGYGEIQYSVAGAVDRRYYLFSGTRLINTTVAIPVYSLETTSATSFLVTAQTTALAPYKGYYVGLLRWYPSSNQYKIVDMGKTDDKGQTVLRVKTEDVDYRLALYQSDGTLIKLLSPIRLICQTTPCTYSLFADPTLTDLTIFNNIQYSLSWNSTTKIFTFTWNDPSQVSQTMNLTIYKLTGTSSDAICSSSASGYTGILTCDVTGFSGTLKAEVRRTASPFSILAQTIVSVREFFTDVSGGGIMGLFIGAILLIFFALIGVFSPVLVVILGIVSLIPIFLLGNISWVVLGAIGVIGGIILHFMRRVQ